MLIKAESAASILGFGYRADGAAVAKMLGQAPRHSQLISADWLLSTDL
jgi:hypothetical protein